MIKLSEAFAMNEMALRSHIGKKVQVTHSAHGHQGKLGTITHQHRRVGGSTNTYTVLHADGTKDDYFMSQLVKHAGGDKKLKEALVESEHIIYPKD